MEMVNRQIVLAELRAHPQNYNRHSAEQLGRLAVSLEKFGQVRSVVVVALKALAEGKQVES